VTGHGTLREAAISMSSSSNSSSLSTLTVSATAVPRRSTKATTTSVLTSCGTFNVNLAVFRGDLTVNGTEGRRQVALLNSDRRATARRTAPVGIRDFASAVSISLVTSLESITPMLYRPSNERTLFPFSLF